MKKLLLGLSFSLLASSAFAADAIVEEVAVEVAPVFSWTGGYIGLQGGYAWGKSQYDILQNDSYSNPDPDGWFGGAYAGYNYQFSNNVVLGIEGDFAFGDVSGGDIGRFTDGVDPDMTVDADMNWSGAVRGRFGYAIDRFLPYVSAGIAFADYDHSLDHILGGRVDFSDTYTGWTVGAGVDYALTDNVLLRAEYRYSDFGSVTYAATPTYFEHEVDLSTNDVRFGIAYKF